MIKDKGSGGGLTDNQWSSLIGIVTAIVGNVLISIALNLQRYAHIKIHKRWEKTTRTLRQTSSENGARDGKKNISRARSDSKGDTSNQNGSADTDETQPLLGPRERTHNIDEEQPKTENDGDQDIPEKSYLREPLWWTGQILMTIGEAGNFLAYGFAPASIVSPLGVVALISNCIIAPFFLKERFRKRDALGVVIAVGGAVTVALSASNNNPKLGPDRLWELIATWEFELYLGFTCAAIAGLMYASDRYGEKSIFIDLALVGLFGGYTALSTKGVASLFSYTIFKALTFGITYLLLFILILTAIMQIKYLNRALRRFNATQVIPTQFVFFTLSVILGSAVLYRDFENISDEQAGKFVGGCVLTFSGVWLITSKRGEGEGGDGEGAEGFEEDAESIRLGAGEEQLEDIRTGDKRQGSMASSRRDSERTPSSVPHLIVRQPTIPSMSESPTPQRQASHRTPPSTLNRPNLDPRSRSSIRNMITNLWSSPTTTSRPPTLPYTTQVSISAPLLPSEAMLQQTNNPRPSTPYLQITSIEEPATPSAPATLTAESARLLHRPSLANLLPGPLAGSWSSPLSGIVADSLRRGVNTTPRNRRDVRGSFPNLYASNLLRRGTSTSGLDPMELTYDEDGTAVESRAVSRVTTNEPWVGTGQGEEEDLSTEGSRVRRFSHAFGEMFRWPSQSRMGSSTGAGPGLGPTNSTSNARSKNRGTGQDVDDV